VQLSLTPHGRITGRTVGACASYPTKLGATSVRWTPGTSSSALARPNAKIRGHKTLGHSQTRDNCRREAISPLLARSASLVARSVSLMYMAASRSLNWLELAFCGVQPCSHLCVQLRFAPSVLDCIGEHCKAPREWLAGARGRSAGIGSSQFPLGKSRF